MSRRSGLIPSSQLACCSRTFDDVVRLDCVFPRGLHLIAVACLTLHVLTECLPCFFIRNMISTGALAAAEPEAVSTLCTCMAKLVSGNRRYCYYSHAISYVQLCEDTARPLQLMNTHVLLQREVAGFMSRKALRV